MRAGLFLAGLWLGCVLGTASATAQREPTPSQFANAVVDFVQGRRPATANGGAAPARQLHARMTGRRLTLPPLSGAERRGAFVLIDGGSVDANDAPSIRLLLAVLVASPSGWQAQAVVEVPLDGAEFLYEDAAALGIARLEDIDDDGELELFAVATTHTEVQCGTGYCSLSRTMIFDVGDSESTLVANISTGLSCQAESEQREEATTVLRDTDGDGHRDLLVRRRVCPGMEYDGEDFVTPACERPVIVTWRWNAQSDRYVPPPVTPATPSP